MSGHAYAKSGDGNSGISGWVIHSPDAISYFPSKSRPNLLRSEIKLEINI